jgi:hypothetical protein
MIGILLIKYVFILKELGAIHTNDWYKENSLYSFARPGFSVRTGHFTQLVWAGSRRVGFGLAVNSKRTTIIGVANYDPPGNVVAFSSFARNVLPARSNKRF